MYKKNMNENRKAKGKNNNMKSKIRKLYNHVMFPNNSII